MNRLYSNILAIACVMACMLIPLRSYALPLETYAADSKLASGHWVKIKVSDSGVYLITPDQLRKWGFQQPERVRVYGYGGNMQSDLLNSSSYVDDLPQAGCEYTPRGLFFYAHGPMHWKYETSGRFTPVHNYYSTQAFYFLSDAPEPLDALPSSGTPAKSPNATSQFTEHLLHESELVSVGATGHRLLGEDFRTRKSQTFSFNLTGNISENVWIRTAFGANIPEGASSAGRITYTINGNETVPSGASISSCEQVEALHVKLVTSTATASLGTTSQKLDLGINFSSSYTVKVARLDNIVINYTRALSLDSPQLSFRVNRAFALAGASENTRIWDVTEPGAVTRVDFSIEGTDACSTPTVSGMREYVAWNPDGAFPSPAYVGTTANQNLHGMETPDMVIFTLPQWETRAEELADIHRAAPQNLNVLVVNAEKVYNEFSSGTPDIGAFRRMLKMMWDRGGGTPTSDSKLRYALMFGRAFHDHRCLTSEGKSYHGSILPQWQSVDGESDNVSYTTEDYLAFLLDGSGSAPGNDLHCIGVGRIPLNSASEAKASVDKIRNYVRDTRKSDWKNRYLLCADDGEAGKFMEQMEHADTLLMKNGRGCDNLHHKVYVDAFSIINGKAPEAHERMNRYLDQGVVWWWFIGHAAATSWTGEGLLELSDINVARYSHAPMLFAATCNFLRWDRLQLSGAEMLFFNPNGIIGAIAATRPVYITNNETMAYGLAMTANLRDDDGNALPIGEVFRRAKNTSRMNDTNKLRYVLMGDPALPLAVPQGKAVFDAIDDVPVDRENPPSIMAQQRFTLSGRVLDNEGNTDTSFNGYVVPTIYDAEYSTTTQGHDEMKDGNIIEGKELVINEMGERLFVGRDNVVNGEFKVKVAMPMEISGNYRPAALNLYAVAGDGSREAYGVDRGFYVYGYASDVEPDNNAPVIEYFGLNTDGFSSGQTVNATPMVIARVRDDVGINISSAGIGHQISLQLDGNVTYPEAVHYYAPGADGAVSGNLNFPMPALNAGPHTLRLRVWDTSNNMAESQIEFNVDPSQAPQIFDLYADCNPARDHTSFIVSHNRPDAVMNVKVDVYDLMGRPVWSGEQNAKSDMGLSEPLTWDLTDPVGRRVNRGIYVYRATVTTDNQQYVSASRKLAVTAP
ncbi:type IX secretion system sortase PorU [uncultured Muribaculum sp.]|uniref:type IX secretion system sortase PorU n=1 Tax=uncultured Muribaculum sp. TaxID=1918613 RepID=UPI00260F3C0B|nr:type IX secretion system sortase PorU [uncultured Muribaculum sp.]